MSCQCEAITEINRPVEEFFAFLAAGTSLVLLAVRRVGMRSFIPFGPFLVGGAVLALTLANGTLTVVR